jgi:catechol 2,3-dioxygenase-like lactoylglutathione lyase family enzyme
MSAIQNLAINGLQHVGIPVTNIAASEDFYRRLGFIKIMAEPFLLPEGEGLCIMMKRGNIVFELYQMPESILKSIRERKDGHIDHIAFDVPDIDETFRTLKQNGFAIIEESPVFLKFWKNGCRYFNVIGPDGERLEFNQIL